MGIEKKKLRLQTENENHETEEITKVRVKTVEAMM